jgi:hypothetical protein
MRTSDTLNLRRLDPELVLSVKRLALERGETVRELCQALLQYAILRFAQDNPDGEEEE